jgi:hypothetical protein
MAEAPRFNIVLLLIAAANLATDVTRLSLEWSPSRGLPNAFRAQLNTGHQGHYASAPEQLREPDSSLKAPAPERLPPRGLPPRANGSVPFSRMRPDFSYRCPPWCYACRYQPICWSDRRRPYQ